MGYSLSTHRWSILSFFITWCARASSTPNNIFFSLGSWEKDILGIHPKTIIIPASFHSKILYCSTTWDELGVTWLTWRTKQRFFFAISRASNLKNFNQLLVTLSGLGFLTMWELSRRVSFFVSSLLSDYLAALFRSFGLPLHFLRSKPSFLHDHFTTQHSDFPVFSSFYDR